MVNESNQYRKFNANIYLDLEKDVDHLQSNIDLLERDNKNLVNEKIVLAEKMEKLKRIHEKQVLELTTSLKKLKQDKLELENLIKTERNRNKSKPSFRKKKYSLRTTAF